MRKGCRAAIAMALAAAAPLAFAQKLNKCPDGKGGTVFQQEKCGETPDQAEARNKERARLEAEAQRRKEEAARKREESVQKARERDQAYEQQSRQRAEELRKAREAEARLMEGTSKGRGFDDGTLPESFAKSHPGAWQVAPDAGITAAFAKNATPRCDQYRYRQRAGGAPEYVVQCTKDKTTWTTYFVWPKSESVRGPAQF